jgi:hypothetical protein
MTDAFRWALVLAVAKKISELGIVPTTLIANATIVGGTYFDCASSQDAQRFRVSGYVSFHDDTDEPSYPIKTVSGTRVTCDFTGYEDANGNPITGFQHAHGAHALVATNLIRVSGNPKQQATTKLMFTSRWPVVRVSAAHSMDDYAASGAGIQNMQAGAIAKVVYQLRSTQPGNANQTMPPDLYLEQQTRRSEEDLHAIKTAIKDDPDRLGGVIQVVEHFVQAARENTTGADPVYEQVLDIYVRSDLY